MDWFLYRTFLLYLSTQKHGSFTFSHPFIQVLCLSAQIDKLKSKVELDLTQGYLTSKVRQLGIEPPIFQLVEDLL